MKMFNKFTLFLLLATTFNSMHAMTEAERRKELGVLFKSKLIEHDPALFINYLNAFDKSTKEANPQIFYQYIADYLAIKFDINAPVNNSYSSLWSQSLLDNFSEKKDEITNFFINHGINVNKEIINWDIDPVGCTFQNRKYSPLTIACFYKKRPLILALIASGADINKLDTYGKTALDYAIPRCKRTSYFDENFDKSFMEFLLNSTFDTLQIPTIYQAIKHTENLKSTERIIILTLFQATLASKTNNSNASFYDNANSLSHDSSLQQTHQTSTTAISKATQLKITTNDDFSWLNTWPEDKK